MTGEATGLVVRSVPLAENDRLLTIFTAELGMVRAVANGSKSVKSRFLAGVQLYSYSRFVLYRKGDFYWVREVELIENFFSLHTSIEKMALASYVAQVTADCAAGAEDASFLRLVLNTLYLIAGDQYTLGHLKAVFEWRAAAELGFMPDITGGCSVCGEADADMSLDLADGRLLCSGCRNRAQAASGDSAGAHPLALLTPGVMAAMRHCFEAPLERLFAFRLSDEEAELFADAAERYLLYQTDRDFKTLQFYKETSN